MADLSEHEFEAANERGRVLFETEPHARSGRHGLRSGMTVIELFNDCTFAFPPRRLQGLEDASDDDLLHVESHGLGYGVHGEACDADFTVGGLMAGRFGRAVHLACERAGPCAILDEAEKNMRPNAT